MRIACVHRYNANDPHSGQGRLHQMFEALKQQSSDFYYFSPLHHRMQYIPIVMAKKVFYKFAMRKEYLASLDFLALKGYALEIQNKLRTTNPDVIVNLMSPQWTAYVETPTPMVVWTDALFADVLDSYPEWARSKFAEETVRDLLASEKAAMERSDLLIFFSDWVTQSAVKHYGIDPGKVRIVPVGPSFDPGLDAGQVEQAILARPAERCRLVFIGMKWERKGGDMALEVARRLNAAGLPTELTLVGSHPPDPETLPPWVTLAGYLEPSTPDGLARLRRLIGSSHFMIVPSRAEAMGIVFCEASAFGVPSLATNVGGITGVIKNGRNGRTFDRDADPDQYCRYVLDMFADFDRYRRLAMRSFKEYETRLNWQTISDQLGRHLRELVADHSSPRQKPSKKTRFSERPKPSSCRIKVYEEPELAPMKWD